MPKKWLPGPLLFVLGGLAITLAAVLAEQLGLDRSAGWGPGRIILLVTGILITGVAGFAWRAAARTRSLISRIEAALGKVPWSLRLLEVIRNYWIAIPISLLVLLVYVWLASSGTWARWESPTRYYADLARGFQQGHLYLAVKVSPELLAASDPYEPLPSGSTRGPIDYSYYNGRYYLPFGAVPALIVVAWRAMFHSWLGDLQLTFGFVCGLLLVECLLAVLLWDRYFRRLPRALLWISLLVIGLAGPVPFMLNNYLSGRVYEAAVTGGQFFMMAGLLIAVAALERSSLRWAFVLAGACWALATATRPDLVLPIGVMVLMVSGWTLLVNGGPARSVRALALLYIPLAAGAVLIGWYNWARFGSIAESGYFYQLTGINLHKHWADQFSLAYILPNLYAYLIHPMQAKAAFPFFDVSPANTPEPSTLQPAFPTYYFSQRITAVPWLAPFLFLAAVPLARSLFNRIHGKSVGAPADSESSGILGWLHITLAASSLVTLLFLLVFFWSAMRYIEDFLPCLMLLSILGFWEGYQSLMQDLQKARLYALLGVFLAAASISISMLAAISVNEARFGLMSLFAAFSR